MERRDPPPNVPPVSLDVNIRGVVIPTWVAITLAIMGISTAGVILLAVFLFKSSSDELIKTQVNQTREIRILDLHMQDIENVLIRNDISTRDDFAKHEEEK